MHRLSRLVPSILLASLFVSACGAAGVRRFPLTPVLWEDPDRTAFAPMPEEREVPYFWDAMDHLIFRPASEVWVLDGGGPAVNVNALDEVPNSSWFVNRIGRHPMTVEELVAGACGVGPYAAPGPWTVTSGKTSGASPGAVIEDANGVRYLLKTDREGQPEQSTAADAIVAAIYHGAGYYVPCNRVVFFDPSQLVLGEGATLRQPNGRRRPMTEDDVRQIREAAHLGEDGRRRVMLSRYIEGRPLGPWNYMGTWPSDPNDVVPHEHRRELRGTYVFDAWVDHWDARQQNSLAAWIDTGGGGGYVRHYLLDFGESLGLVEGNHRRAPRFGHTTFMNLGHMVEDFFGLGIVQRPWDGRRAHPVLGFYSVEYFDPDRWSPQYWNGALERRTEGDIAWASRILARFEPGHVRALLALGRYSDPAVEREVERRLLARRRALLQRSFARRSALADPVGGRVADGRMEVCLRDLAVSSGVAQGEEREYEAALYAEPEFTPLALDPPRADADRVCVLLPEVRPGESSYLVLDVHADRRRTPPLRMHFYVTDVNTITLVGLERPGSSAPPEG